jgi:hypothetical protein
MNTWTNESLRAENDYRREQLHRLASHRSVGSGRRDKGWLRFLRRSQRH